MLSKLTYEHQTMLNFSIASTGGIASQSTCNCVFLAESLYFSSPSFGQRLTDIYGNVENRTEMVFPLVER